MRLLSVLFVSVTLCRGIECAGLLNVAMFSIWSVWISGSNMRTTFALSVDLPSFRHRLKSSSSTIISLIDCCELLM
uniref:Secreted protein n=1 Tax=Picea sitchensis TaxID=3332 RepID=B8LNC1_PICSI|nr:unknown [Picea sitchensis]